MTRGRGYRYGRWRGGPDPLAPPYDLGNAVDEIGDSVLAGSGVREALRELLRRGMDGRRGLDLTGLQEHFTGGETVESGELVPGAALLGQLGTIPRLAELLGRLGVPEGEESAEQAAAAVEFALEGLYLTRRLAKDTDGTRTVYGA